MASKHPWYDAIVAASASCCWMGAWPPAQWLYHMHPEGGTAQQQRPPTEGTVPQQRSPRLRKLIGAR